jgi:ABC-type transport system involved in multi-copper enzyme maturation permease subunit
MSTATDSPLDYHAPEARRLHGPARAMAQTWALVADAYRELNSRLLFWIALGLSGLVALIFMAIGFDEEGVSFFGKRFSDFPNTTIVPAADFYKGMFLDWGVGLWITWAATILALITTAGIFPDLISGGSIDLYLSKPLGRMRLFLTKYLVGLMFVALQIAVFCVACFLVIGIRGGAWAPSIFIVIPIVTIYYSFLFCVTVLVGTITGSTLASVLVTLLFWFALFIVNTADGTLLVFKTSFDVDAQGYAARIERNQATIARWEADPDNAPGQIYRDGVAAVLAKDREVVEQRRKTAEQLDFWHTLVLRIKTPLPKTGESIDILKRWLIESEELAPTQAAVVTEPITGATDLPSPNATTQAATGPSTNRRRTPESPMEAADSPVVIQNVQAEILQRSAWWAFGTSLIFEAVVLAIAAWSFVRRDF